MKKNKNKSEKVIWISFFVAGLIFFVVGGIWSAKVFNYENKIETTGIITDMEAYRDIDGDVDYDVYVSYNVNGKEYESRLNSYSATFYQGKKIDIYYDKEDPNKIGMKSMDLLFLIVPGIGILFMIGGGFNLLSKNNQKKLGKKLKETGELVHANYVKTRKNTSYAVNGVHPYNIICEWNNPENNKKCTFKSENLWSDPQKLIEEKNVKTIPVYLNPENKKQYFMDLDYIFDEDTIDIRK